MVRDPNNGIIDASGGEPLYGNLVFSAAKVVPTAADNRPVNVAIPVILYLGLRARVFVIASAFPRVDAWGGPGSGELAGGRDTQRYG